MSKYIRTSPLNFSELPKETQDELSKDIELSDLHEDSYVLDPCDNTSYLPLSMFIRSNGGLWHGIYGTSYFSAYFIRFDRRNDVCTVGYRHW